MNIRVRDDTFLPRGGYVRPIKIYAYRFGLLTVDKHAENSLYQGADMPPQLLAPVPSQESDVQ